jgi:sporulation protein YlmC with PRC-barrel domain
LIGAKVLDSDGSEVGRIKDIEVFDVQTGVIAYCVRPPGLRGLWVPAFSVPARAVVTARTRTIVIGAGVEASAAKEEERWESTGKRAA